MPFWNRDKNKHQKQDLAVFATELKTYAPRYEYLILRLPDAIFDTNQNFSENEGGYRTLADLANFGYKIDHIIFNLAKSASGKHEYIYYLVKEVSSGTED